MTWIFFCRFKSSKEAWLYAYSSYKKYLYVAEQRYWSDWTDAQADLHLSFPYVISKFCHDAADLNVDSKS